MANPKPESSLKKAVGASRPSLAPVAALILAAGKGTRMKSRKPKVLHAVGGRPMLLRVVDVCSEAGVDDVVVVTGHGDPLVREALGDRARCVLQEEQLGTGHAVMMAAPLLKDFPGDVLICCGDTPLLRAETLRKMLTHRREQSADRAGLVLTAKLDDPHGYGRVERDKQGRALRIIEQKDATPEERRINEINTGVYCVEAAALFGALPRLGRGNAQGEYYLTDIVSLLAKDGRSLDAFDAADSEDILGVNSREQLAEAEAVHRWRVLKRLMAEGVTLVDPDTAFIEDTVKIGPDTVIRPMCEIRGDTVIGEECLIGPGARIRDGVLGDGVRFFDSTLWGSSIGDGAAIGPGAFIHGGAEIAPGVRIGGVAEIVGEKVFADESDFEDQEPDSFYPEPSRVEKPERDLDALLEEKELEEPSQLRGADPKAPGGKPSLFPSGWQPSAKVPPNVEAQLREIAELREERTRRKEAERAAMERAAERANTPPGLRPPRIDEPAAEPVDAAAAELLSLIQGGAGSDAPPRPAAPKPEPVSPREKRQAEALGSGKRVKIDPESPELLAIERACDVLLNGGLVAFPTDTVYGLACDATNKKAVEKLRAAKRRDPNKPLVAMVHNDRMLRLMLRRLPAKADELIDAFWPGALTIVFERPKAVLEALSADMTIACRMPSQTVPLSIISMIERPLAVTSVNISGEAPARTAGEIAEELGDAIDLILDAPVDASGLPSTVLDLSKTPARIVREGGVTREALRAILGEMLAE